MSQVGMFPGLGRERSTKRAPVNPIDKSTIFSIYPKDITIRNPTLTPGVWTIAAGSVDKPARLVVEPSSWWRDFDPEQPLLEIPVGSSLIANSLVEDYISGMLACDMGENRPGLFFVLDNVPVSELKTKYKVIFDQAVQRQRNYWNVLTKMADIYWARTNGNPLAINEDMRIGAKELGYDRPWAREFSKMELASCPACGNLRNQSFPVCMHCKTIVDMKKYNELGLAGAK